MTHTNEPLQKPGRFKLVDYTYSMFGITTADAASNNPIQYTGRENDGIACLYYYRNRYYSPCLGRFISWDPIGLGGGMDPYAYAGGNPLQYTDPLGLSPTNSSSCDDCKKKYLRNYYGNFVADWLVPNMSLGSYIPGGPYSREAWGGVAESAVVKGGGLGALGAVANFFANRAAQTVATSASNFGPLGAWIKADAIAADFTVAGILNGFIAGASKYATVVGAGVTAFATTADIMAILDCR